MAEGTQRVVAEADSALTFSLRASWVRGLEQSYACLYGG